MGIASVVVAIVKALIPKANKLQRVRQKELRQQEESCTESDANSCLNFSHSQQGAHAGLFIGEVKGLITMP
jgi:hypothetical protein